MGDGGQLKRASRRLIRTLPRKKTKYLSKRNRLKATRDEGVLDRNLIRRCRGGEPVKELRAKRGSGQTIAGGEEAWR